MTSPHPIFKEHNIVLIGSFNPKIFQPAWFGSQGLIQKQEAEAAEIEIIHPDIAIFRLDWLRVEVIRERFIVRTTQEAFDPIIRDLVLGTFDLLRFTPIKKIGINREIHFQMESEEKWHSAGHTLVPKELWNKVLESPGLFSLTVDGNRNRDGLKGFIHVKVDPSSKVPMGISFSVNDHYEVEDVAASAGSDEIIKILKQNWEKSYKRSEDIIYSLFKELS